MLDVVGEMTVVDRRPGTTILAAIGAAIAMARANRGRVLLRLNGTALMVGAMDTREQLLREYQRLREPGGET